MQAASGLAQLPCTFHRSLHSSDTRPIGSHTAQLHGLLRGSDTHCVGSCAAPMREVSGPIQ
eukprot:5014014-Pyramimonas_sp.AAC.2